MSNLSKLVRRVLLEAAPVASEPQSSAKSAQRTMSAAAKKAKDENAISPNSYVDPAAFIVRSSVGYPHPPKYATKILAARTGDKEKSQVLGDSAVSDSQVYRGSTVKDSVVSDSSIAESSVTGASVSGDSLIVDARVSGGSIESGSFVARSTLTDCKLTNRSRVAGDTYQQRELAVQYSSLANSRVEATVPKALVSQVSMKDSVVTLKRQGSRVINCKLTNAKIHLMGGARDSYVMSAEIEDSDIGQEYGTAPCDVVIKGAGASRVFISNAFIRDSATIIATKGPAPQITGYPQQRAIIEEHAKIYDSAHVAGRVSGNAEVFGNALVEANAHITGTCRVGGTARMAKGTYSSGEYMEGTFTGGDEAYDYSVTSRAKQAVSSAADAISAGVKGLVSGGDDQ